MTASPNTPDMSLQAETVGDRAKEMLTALVGPVFSDTALRVATDWLKQERRLATPSLHPEGEGAKPSWRCFHCGEVFTSEQCARLHFGRNEDSEPACVIKAGAEGSLLKALRHAEEAADDAIQMMHAESTDAAKAYHAQRSRHNQALIAAEELGYERGLADGRALTVSEGTVSDDGLPQRMLASLLSGTCGVPRGHMEYNDECICGDREASEALIVLGLAYSSDRWPMAGVFLTGIGESLKERMADSAFVKSLTASRERR